MRNNNTEDVNQNTLFIVDDHSMLKNGLKNYLEMNTQYRKSGQSGSSDARDIHGYDQRDYSGEQKAALERMMRDTWGDDNA